MFRYIFAAALSLNGFAAASEKENNCTNGKRHYRSSIRHIESGGIGYEEGYTTLEAFLAPDPSYWKVTPFLDARGHIFDHGKWAANAGGGIRTLWGNQAYGINAYYDYRNAGRFHSHQIGAGLEMLGELFDLRINGYLPVGKKTSAPYDPVFQTFSGNYMLILQKIQAAMKGANAEFGIHLGKSELFDFYAAAGPYYFIGENIAATWGGKARVSGTFKEILTLEISDSYDKTFHNKFQGLASLNFSFGPRSKIKERASSCKLASTLNDRMLQSVERQEIIVVGKTKKNSVAINPITKAPYFFVFVDNTSNSNGTYESPYHSLAQAQSNSSQNDILYVFPGDGTTKGMNSGIFLKDNQKFWGSGVSHSIQTSVGVISIPVQSNSSPIITNTDFDTEGNAITLGDNNAISGFTISDALNDAIYGTNIKSLEVSSCTFQNTTTYAIEAIFPTNALISITNNQFLNNVNGIFLTLNGTSTVTCSNNAFKDQTSVSSVPLEIAANLNTFTAKIENNLFQNNVTGSVRFNLTDVVNGDIKLFSNTMTNNGTGSQASLASSFAILPTGTVNNCSIALANNTFSNNTSNALYLHTSGAFTTLNVTASANTMSNNGGAGLVLATPVSSLTLLADGNTITACNDNGIAVINSSSTTTTGVITITNNTINNIGNSSNGIAINQDFSTLDLIISNNGINGCEGTGIISYAPNGINSLTMTISGNTISNCQNLSSNAASAIDIEQYTNLAGSITNNTLLNNVSSAVVISGSSLSSPSTCLTLSGNTNSADYSLINPADGPFNLSPCNVNVVNTGTINRTGTINPVQSCPDATPCPP